MADPTKADLEAQLAELQKAKEKSDAAAKRALDHAAAAQARADELARERDELRANAPAEMRPRTVTGKKQRTEKVAVDDIQRSEIRELVDVALDHAPDFRDSAEGRAELASQAQDCLIGLRLIGVNFEGQGVVLKNGDLYVHAAGVHPREASEALQQNHTVAELVDLVESLKKQLEYEAA